MPSIVSRNPATGLPLATLPVTEETLLPQLFAQGREAQASWSQLPLKKRASILLELRETLLDRVDEVTDLIQNENGKPRFEALANEILPSIDLLSFFSDIGPKTLADQKLPLRLMRHRQSVIQRCPMGVVLIISPWNYPWLLPFGEIVMALVAGNAVIFKPSEVTPLVGQKIQELVDLSGFPKNLLQTVIGDGALGKALIDQKPDKIFFTGSVATGKKIMAQAAQYLIPVNLELGGKDPMIILPDANLDYATSAAIWGGFGNSGQVCASVERLIVHESIAKPFSELLAKKLKTLRQGPSDEGLNDLGPITSPKQAEIYKAQIADARSKEAHFISGGSLIRDDRYLEPTLVSGKNVEALTLYNDETFGPVIAITTFRSIPEAIEKANATPYGLLASVITQNLALGEQVARQIQAGSVLVNEVTYTAGLGETPWGGFKHSGIGRTHSAEGLYEFTQIRHIHRPRRSWLTHKSPWWFPYSTYQYQLFRRFLDLYRRSWLQKIRALPDIIYLFIHFVKYEKRL